MPLIHLDTASHLPHWQDALVAHACDPSLPPVGWHLAAMAKPPSWVRAITHGRPDGAFAEGPEVSLMEGALTARANPLWNLANPILATYRAALDSRWAQTDFTPGVWAWTEHGGGRRAGDQMIVRDGSRIVCTCPRGAECHLRWLAPFVARDGWCVFLHGEPWQA